MKQLIVLILFFLTLVLAINPNSECYEKTRVSICSDFFVSKLRLCLSEINITYDHVSFTFQFLNRIRTLPLQFLYAKQVPKELKLFFAIPNQDVQLLRLLFFAQSSPIFFFVL